MPTALRIDSSARIVYSTLFGAISTADLIAHIERIRRHSEFDPSFNELIDATEVTSFDISSDAVRELASQASPFSPNALRVFVASEDLVFGLARMFQAFGSEIRPHFVVTRTLEDAYRRLGINPLQKAE